VPIYRDLRPGAEGEDVAQLQRALHDLGHTSSEPDGSFGPATKRAVQAFYGSLGYSAPFTGEDDRTAVQAAEALTTELERQVEDLGEALRDATGEAEIAVARRQRDRAEEDLAAARDQLAELERTTGPMVPASELVFLPAFPARVHTL